MRLKICPCCKKQVTTSSAKVIGRKLRGGEVDLYLNCVACDSTFLVSGFSVNKKEIIAANTEDWRFPLRGAA